MHTFAMQLQFLLLAVLSLLGLAAAGSVLLITVLQRREEATERPRAAQAQWHAQTRGWRRRYALAAAALAAVLVLFGLLAFSRQMA